MIYWNKLQMENQQNLAMEWHEIPTTNDKMHEKKQSQSKIKRKNYIWHTWYGNSNYIPRILTKEQH